MYIRYADENKIIFVWTILSTTMTTTDAGLTQIDCTNAWWCKITHTVVSLALMLIAYAQKPPVNVHSWLIYWEYMFYYYPGIYLHPYFVYASYEGYGEDAHLRRLAWAFIAGLYDMC